MRPKRTVEPSGPAVLLAMNAVSASRSASEIGRSRYVRQE